MRPTAALLLAALALTPAALALTPARAAAAELELIPMLGVADLGFQDDDFDDDIESGLVLGVSFGGRLARVFSLHGQIFAHAVEVDDSDEAGVAAIVQLAALFHVVDNRTLDFMLGPVLGGFSVSFVTEAPGDDITTSLSGPTFGLQAGLYFKLDRKFALGPMVQFSRLYASEVCVERGRDSSCRELDDDAPDFDLDLLVVSGALKITF